MIIINEYIVNLSSVRMITRESLEPYKDIIRIGGPIGDNDYYLAWGDPVNKTKYGVSETGFFWDAMHIDTNGLYSNCSLNTPQAQKMIDEFKAPKSATDIILNGRLPKSKYTQAGGDVYWDGVVLALQNPSDRSIHRGSSTEDYYRFVEGACKFYNRNLYLKLHPWNSGDVEKRLTEIANKYGSIIGRANHSVIENCKFVLVYNSTFAVDCLIRGVKVAYFAPGYFWQTKAVQYTNYQYPDDINTNVDNGYKLCDFMIYKYLFNQGMNIEKWINMLKHFSISKELFPINDEFCYANNI